MQYDADGSAYRWQRHAAWRVLVAAGVQTAYAEACVAQPHLPPQAALSLVRTPLHHRIYFLRYKFVAIQ